MLTKALLSLAVLAASVASTPLDFATRQSSAPATVVFTPYEQVGCLMSMNPHSGLKPTSFNVTSGHCFTPSYSFQSYVEVVNFDPKTTPCALSIFPEVDCGGEGAAATLTTWGQCDANQGGKSFELVCGP